MKSIYYLLQKELIEYRIVIKLPLFLALLAVVNFALVMSGDNVSFSVQTSGFGDWGSEIVATGYAGFIGKLNEWVAGLVFFTLFLVYIPKTLRKERKEGSLMFWRSVPVSDHLAIAIKLLFGLAVIPLICSVLLLFSDVIVWILANFLMTGELLNSFSVTLPSMMLHWGAFIGRLALISLSLFPMACLLMVVSQLTNYPMVTVIVAAIVIKLTSYMLFGSSVIGDFISDVYSLPLSILTSEQPLDAYLQMGLLTQLLLLMAGGVLFYLCSRLRSTDDYFSL